MMEVLEIGLWASVVGIGATILLDLWIALFSKLGFPGPDWAMVGRWVGHMPKGRFFNEDIAAVPAVKGELALGWVVHYATGIAYGLILVGIWGAEWLQNPTTLPPLILLWVFLVAPYFFMMPGLGEGVAASRTAKPNFERMQSVVGHSVFGAGMYLTALAINGVAG